VPRTELLDDLHWRLVGPFRGGRVVAVGGDPAEPRTFEFGSTGGGVWGTPTSGLYWENIPDGSFAHASVGSIAVSPSDPNVQYAGMGEWCLRNNVPHGDGVYRSTNRGKTWTHLSALTSRPAEVLPLDDRGTIARGRRADLLVLGGDPLRDPTALDVVAAVFLEGVRVR